MRYTYRTEGTCSAEISFALVDGKVHDVQFLNGCAGNLRAIARLVEGLTPDDIAEKCRGIECGQRGTSCSDQLSKAVLDAKKAMTKGE